MGRKFASRLTRYQSDTPQYVTIDIIQTSTSAETTSNIYTGLKAVESEKQITEVEGLIGEVGTKYVKVFMVEPQNGVLPTVTERMRVRYDGDTDSGLKILSVNPSSGHIQLLEIVTEKGRD